MRRLCAPARLRAAGFGAYRSSLTAASTAARVASRTLRSPLTTRETVIGETPALRATSWMVVPRLLRRLVLRAGARPEAMISYSRAARHKGRNRRILPESRWRERHSGRMRGLRPLWRAAREYE